jgi:uncharacterized membrane protein YfcA
MRSFCSLAMLEDFSLSTLALASICILAAAIVRGFTGFGLAVVGVPLLTVFIAPARIVPPIMILAVLAGVQLMPRIWRAIDWHLLTPAVIGAALGTPLGTMALAVLSDDAMRLLIGLAVLAAAAAIYSGLRFKTRPGLAVSGAMGVLSGVTSGAAAMSAPSAVFLFLLAPIPVESGRACLITFFLLSAAISAASAWSQGLMTLDGVALGAALLPAMLIGNYLGDRLFAKSSAETYRGLVIAILAGLGLIAALRGGYGLLEG